MNYINHRYWGRKGQKKGATPTEVTAQKHSKKEHEKRQHKKLNKLVKKK